MNLKSATKNSENDPLQLGKARPLLPACTELPDIDTDVENDLQLFRSRDQQVVKNLCKYRTVI